MGKRLLGTDWTMHGCAQTFYMSQVKTHTCMSVSGQLPSHSLDCKLGGHVVSIHITVSTCISDRKEYLFFLATFNSRSKHMLSVT